VISIFGRKTLKRRAGLLLRQNKYFQQMLLGAVLIIMTTVLSVASEYFFAWKNFRNILDQSAVYLILSVGMTFVVASGGVDLSVGSVAGLSGVIMAVVMKGGAPVFFAVLAGILAGAAIGVVNGITVSVLKINSFITTLAMLTITRGIALILTGGVSIYGFPQGFKWWGSGTVGLLNPPIVLSMVIASAAMALLGRTLWGKYCLALGDNAEALRRTGVNTVLYRVSVYAVSGLCAAVTGLIMTARLNSAAPLAGATYEMDAIAAVVLGGGNLNGGCASVLGTLIACLTLSVMRNGLTLLAVSTHYQQVITGGIVLAAIIISELRNPKNKETEN
jgi:ribose/xylose/arabinose/galactoside ABC-type transport system permease subunit